MSENRVLVLRTCAADMTSHGGFRWPEKGPVSAPDWLPTPDCGNGLHGWLWGEGDGSLGNWSADAKWLVVAVDPAQIIDLKGKVKFPAGEVLFCGSRLDATAYLAAQGPGGKAIIGGTATAGDRGTATAGDRGTATAGECGTATAGDCGIIQCREWDAPNRRYRVHTGYIGEAGLLPRVKYHLVNGLWQPVNPIAPPVAEVANASATVPIDTGLNGSLVASLTTGVTP